MNKPNIIRVPAATKPGEMDPITRNIYTQENWDNLMTDIIQVKMSANALYLSEPQVDMNRLIDFTEIKLDRILGRVVAINATDGYIEIRVEDSAKADLIRKCVDAGYVAGIRSIGKRTWNVDHYDLMIENFICYDLIKRSSKEIANATREAKLYVRLIASNMQDVDYLALATKMNGDIDKIKEYLKDKMNSITTRV